MSMSSLGSPSYYSPRSQDQLDGTPTHGNSNRKRVGKACDRCRLKKSKCDGSNPCHRCNQADQVCTFTERKRPKGRIYPDGYVEILESKCQVLIQGLIELDRLRKHLPPANSKAQSITGLASGKQANQILKDIGIDTTLTDSDLEDEDDGHEPNYYHDDEDCMTSSNGSPEPGDGWMQNQQQQSRHQEWIDQSPMRHSNQYYPQEQVMSTNILPHSPSNAIDYNSSTLPQSSASSYYSHLHGLQLPAAVAGPSILPPSPPTTTDYNLVSGPPYSVGQQLPPYYNSMDAFDLNALVPAPGEPEQNYYASRYRY